MFAFINRAVSFVGKTLAVAIYVPLVPFMVFTVIGVWHATPVESTAALGFAAAITFGAAMTIIEGGRGIRQLVRA